jgi:hypothetical protein
VLYSQAVVIGRRQARASLTVKIWYCQPSPGPSAPGSAPHGAVGSKGGASSRPGPLYFASAMMPPRRSSNADLSRMPSGPTQLTRSGTCFRASLIMTFASARSSIVSGNMEARSFRDTQPATEWKDSLEVAVSCIPKMTRLSWCSAQKVYRAFASTLSSGCPYFEAPFGYRGLARRSVWKRGSSASYADMRSCSMLGHTLLWATHPRPNMLCTAVLCSAK